MRFPLLTRLASLAFLLVASSAYADPPTLPDAPKDGYKVDPKEPIVLKVNFKADAEIGYQTTFAGRKGTFFFEGAPVDKGERQFIFWASQPGTYHVVFWTKTETKGTVATIVVGGTVVDNGNTTDPVQKPLWGVLLVRDPTQVTTLLSKYELHPGLNALKTERKYQLQTISKNNTTDPTYAKYVKQTEGKTFPHYFVIGTDGSVVTSGALPAEPDDLVKILKKVGSAP